MPPCRRRSSFTSWGDPRCFASKTWPTRRRGRARRACGTRRSGSTSSTSTSVPGSTSRRRCRSSRDRKAAGVVEAIGPDVTDVAVGDRVAYAGLQGSYAEVRLVPAARLVKLPPAIDDRTAAAMMLKGMTAEYLLLRIARVERGDTILFHAAAGGVGSIACQWAKALGARVIGTAGGRRQGRARARAGVRRGHRLPARGHRRAGQGDHGRGRGAGGVRRRRQEHVRCFPGLPGDARHARAVRAVVGGRWRPSIPACWRRHRCS